MKRESCLECETLLSMRLFVHSIVAKTKLVAKYVFKVTRYTDRMKWSNSREEDKLNNGNRAKKIVPAQPFTSSSTTRGHLCKRSYYQASHHVWAPWRGPSQPFYGTRVRAVIVEECFIVNFLIFLFFLTSRFCHFSPLKQECQAFLVACPLLNFLI